VFLPRRVAIVGPTASGKSAVAMAVARELGDVDLVSVDSMQVYRGMDVGTAKPSATDRAEVRHHLLDLVDPTEEFTVAQFRLAYDEALVTIGSAGRRALLVGGTGLYHRVVVDEFDLPGQWPELRAELEAAPDTATLFARLTRLDPAAAEKMEPSNRRRVVRALEVTLGSGRPFSSFGPGVDEYPTSPVAQVGLRWPREVLTERIAARVHEMVTGGLFDEVAGIEARGGFSRTAAQALGYKETLDALAGRMSNDEAIDTIITRTRQFAVRQERWFRRDPRVRWIDIEADAVVEATPVVLDAFDT
jgi:tRNA dimethylallyltransferase